MHIPTPSSALAAAAPGAILACLLACAPAAHAADSVFDPYAADVRRAIAPLPGENPRPGLDPNGNESAACRQLRIQIDRLREAPPSAPADAYPEGPRRDGLPSLSRSRLSGPAPDGRRQALETRYHQECQ